MNYYRGSAWRKLRSRRIQSLQPYLKRLGWLSRPKSVKLPASKHLRWLRTTPCSKRSSTANVKMLRSFVKRVFGLNLPPSAQGLRGSSTLANAAPYQSPFLITARRRVVGRQQKARRLTCKTSSEVHSYAKRLWLPKATVSSWVTSRRLSREYSRGFRITQRCLTSFGQEVILMPRSVRRCLTFPDLVKNRTQIYGSLQKAHYLAVATGSDGLRLRHSYLQVSLAHRQSGTTLHSQKNSALLKRLWNAL